MLRWIQKIISITVVITVVLTVFLRSPIYAIGTTCEANVSPDNVAPFNSTNFSLGVFNTGTTDIHWISITVPSSKFTYIGNYTSDWTTADHTGGTTMTGNTIGQGMSSDFSMSANTDANASPVNWQVLVSENADGSNATTCGGNSLATGISGHPPNDSVYGVYDMNVSNITSSSATINWQSDSPTSSLVYYGSTSDYRQISNYDQTTDTNHSVTLTGLSPESGYHYQVAGSDGQGTYAYSADNTFLTTVQIIDKSANQTPSTTSQQSVIVGKDPAADRIAPQILLDTKLSGAYKIVPTLSGSASDDKSLALVEYSTDGGKNWLPAEILKKTGQTKLSYSFTPLLPQDGNYEILARATDSTGNMTMTASQSLIIDRLPPLVGANVVSVGPQIVQPDNEGTINALQGVDQKITLSAVGGPINISLVATTTKDSKTYTQSYNLTESKDSGLWSGVMSFSKPGTYRLTAYALDGAGNKTSRELNNIYVSSPGYAVDSSSHKPIVSTVTLYYLEPESQTWVIWDAAAFGQTNPQTTDKAGAFSMFLPIGTFYIKATSPGYDTFIGSIFKTNQPTPLTTSLNLSAIRGFHIGKYDISLPSLLVEHTSIASLATKNAVPSSMIGKSAPDFSLTDTNGTITHTVDLLGRPTLISFNSTWSPTSSEQLRILSKLQSNPDLNIIPVALQENSGHVSAYTAIADMKLRWLVDPNSTTSDSYNVRSLPMHYFIDRKGIIRQVIIGVRSEQQLLDTLSTL